MFGQRPPICCAVALLLVTCVFGSGCRGAIYQARSLPAQYTAAPSANLAVLDLGSIGGSTWNSELIYPGDIVDVAVATGVERGSGENWVLRVRDDGMVDVPLIGPVPVANQDFRGAERSIRLASMERQVYHHPSISIRVKQRRTKRVVVTGAVKHPDTYELPAADSTLLTALLAAGGLEDSADRYVEIRQPTHTDMGPPQLDPAVNFTSGVLPSAAHQGVRPREHVTRIDLLSAVANHNGNIPLTDGAVITVMQQEPRYIHVLGLVRNQRQLELPPGQNFRLLDAVAMAGGPSMSMVIADKVHIVRRKPGSNESILIQASMRRAKRDIDENILIAAGDVISVEETPLTFTIGTMQGLLGIGVNAARVNF